VPVEPSPVEPSLEVEAKELETKTETGDQDIILKFSEWAFTSASTIGADRTSQIIDSFYDKGWLEIKNRKLLLRLVSMNRNGECPDKVTINQILGVAMKFTKLIDAKIEIDDVLTLIEKADLG
jgi:hypothetical protein